MMGPQDKQIADMLAGWAAPAAHPDAVARILAAAGAQAMPAPRRWPRGWQLVGAPALAAAMVLGIIAWTPHDTLPKNDPVLQQSALHAFAMEPAGSDTADLAQ